MAQIQREHDAACPECGSRDFVRVETLGPGESNLAGGSVSFLYRLEKWLRGIKRVECGECGKRFEVQK